MSFYSFKYNLSIVNVFLMKNRRFYEIYVSNSNNSVVFYFLLHLLVNTYYPLGSSQPLSSLLRSSPLRFSPLLFAPLHSSPLQSFPLRSAPLLSTLGGRKYQVCRLQNTLYVYQEANSTRYLVKVRKTQGLPSI